jgi:AmmeMemoRadiSam system protein B
MNIRRAAVAGSWYPGSPAVLAGMIDRYLAAPASPIVGDLVALVCPHAGLTYSGPVAARAFAALRGRRFDVAAIVGPSHYVAFEGVAIYRGQAFETPLGTVAIDEGCASTMMSAAPIVHERPAAHRREHAIEMQLPFLQRVAPDLSIVPLLMGDQRADTIKVLADALAAALSGRDALLIASSDLSHYQDAGTAARLDRVVLDRLDAFDEEGLQDVLARRPEHACGGGAIVAVMRAARVLGARDGVVLHYADSGDVSGDKSAVVGYAAAAFGAFTPKRV